MIVNVITGFKSIKGLKVLKGLKVAINGYDVPVVFLEFKEKEPLSIRC